MLNPVSREIVPTELTHLSITFPHKLGFLSVLKNLRISHFSIYLNCNSFYSTTIFTVSFKNSMSQFSFGILQFNFRFIKHFILNNIFKNHFPNGMLISGINTSSYAKKLTFLTLLWI